MKEHSYLPSEARDEHEKEESEPIGGQTRGFGRMKSAVKRTIDKTSRPVHSRSYSVATNMG